MLIIMDMVGFLECNQEGNVNLSQVNVSKSRVILDSPSLGSLGRRQGTMPVRMILLIP